jgi:BirA family biotin operon repressor/biotin-[acetyl-CoA-carboxylase] ligase
VQTAGRGRLDRRWICPPRAALSFSVLLRPDGVPAVARGWIPLLAGVAVAAGLRAQAGLDARLKWPNDVLVGGAKIAGILAEQAGDAIVLGIGINVTTRRDELPVPNATSVVLAGAAPDRGQLLVAVLGELETWYRRWVAAMAAGPPVVAGTVLAGTVLAGTVLAGTGPAGPGGDPAGLRAEYLRLSATVGQQVRVSMPGGKLVTGWAGDLDATGRLVVETASGPVPVSAGDVVHVR